AWEMRPSTVAMKSSPVLIFEWHPRIAAPSNDYWSENLRRSDAEGFGATKRSYRHIYQTSLKLLSFISIDDLTSV
ncbi:MAG TPA: hypothetical protein VGP09_02550, partial [Caballeronia sp.]|nr:hypothetical protein [Caballeronia sp.]